MVVLQTGSAESFPLLVLSTFLVIPIIMTNICVSKRYQGMSIFSTLFCLTSLLFSAAMLYTVARKKSFELSVLGCYIQGIIIQFSAVSMVTLWMIIAYILKVVVVHKQRTLFIRKLIANKGKAIILSLIPPILLTAIPLTLAPAVPQRGAPICWIQEDVVTRIAAFDGWMLLALIIGGFQSCVVVQHLVSLAPSKKYSAPSDDTEESARMLIMQKTIKDYVVRHTLFLVGFLFVFIGIAQNSIVNWWSSSFSGANRTNTTSRPANRHELSDRIFQDTYSIIGILVFLVFGTALDMRTLWWRWLCWFNKHTEDGLHEEEDNGIRRDTSIAISIDNAFLDEVTLRGSFRSSISSLGENFNVNDTQVSLSKSIESNGARNIFRKDVGNTGHSPRHFLGLEEGGHVVESENQVVLEDA